MKKSIMATIDEDVFRKAKNEMVDLDIGWSPYIERVLKERFDLIVP